MISSHANLLFEQLREVALTIEGRKVPILETLKHLPRSGKSLRINKYGLDLPKRSVYDHICSLPQQADFFLSLSNADLDQNLLTALLVFHDLSEAVIGDTPNCTHFEPHTFLTGKRRDEAEEKTNLLLCEAMPHELKRSFEKFLEEKNTPLYQFFYMIDKTDPIIAIWRYLFLFQGKIEIDKFLSAMADFFHNPEPQRTCPDGTILSVVQLLQNREHAKNFYLNPHDYFRNYGNVSLQSLITGREMHFVK